MCIRDSFHFSLFGLAACFCVVWFAAPSFGQQIAPQIPTVAGGESAKPEIDKAKLMGTRPAEPPPVLQQLNFAIEQLTARISPAVVQILVTGFGPLEDNNHSQTALITREHAIGSGAVSYTHLDVYKRQVHRRVTLCGAGPVVNIGSPQEPCWL